VAKIRKAKKKDSPGKKAVSKKYDPAPSQRFVQSHTSCRTETTDEEISALTEVLLRRRS
jgi:hypothetical protein